MDPARGAHDRQVKGETCRKPTASGTGGIEAGPIEEVLAVPL
jgi:hypothetical protein